MAGWSEGEEGWWGVLGISGGMAMVGAVGWEGEVRDKVSVGSFSWWHSGLKVSRG